MRLRFVPFLVAAGGLFAGPISAQVVFTINPTIDAFGTNGPTGNDRSNNNYGGAGALSISAVGKPTGEFQSLLKFNLASTVAAFNSAYGAGQWTLQSITLRFTAQNPGNAIFNTSSAGTFGASWQQNDSWTEGTGSPNTPTADGVTFALFGPPNSPLQSAADEALGTLAIGALTSGNFTITLQLPPGFTNDVMAGGDVSLRLYAADPNVSVVFNSNNFTTPANRPLLSVTAVPEPATWVCLLIAGAAVALMQRKRLTSRCA